MTDMIDYYSAALDEIYQLRAALASEARIVEAHLDYKTFPKSRRLFAVEQIARMRAAARWGTHGRAYSVDRHYDTNDALRSVGASVTLTRHQWEQEVDRANAR